MRHGWNEYLLAVHPGSLNARLNGASFKFGCNRPRDCDLVPAYATVFFLSPGVDAASALSTMVSWGLS